MDSEHKLLRPCMAHARTCDKMQERAEDWGLLAKSKKP